VSSAVAFDLRRLPAYAASGRTRVAELSEACLPKPPLRTNCSRARTT